ncbi:hypothetical protein [uncultured Arcticibacterium sp.]|uniref:hypothetical protein n=1 Tax=uncultured Arcticibacterium sp. TaxID=2173042 RepID=UPI0030FC8321
MDKNLANYLFHNETLYFNTSISEKENTDIEPVKVGQKTQVNSTIKEKVEVATPQPQPQPHKEVKTPEVNSEEAIPFKMSTPYLVVLKGITAEEREFLVKVLMALNMSLAKVDLLDTVKYNNPDFKEIIYNNSIRSILFLGEEAGGDFLPKLRLSPYTIKEIKNINFLHTANLRDISLNKNNEKRMLWENLKSLYGN